MPALHRLPGANGYAVDGIVVARVTEVLGLVRLQRPSDPPQSAHEVDAARDEALTLTGPFARHVHEATAAYPDTIECAPDVCKGDCSAFVEQFARFCRDFQPRFIAREQAVFSATHGYAGTPDWIAEIDGDLLIGDTKLGAPFPQVALQLAAYRYAEFLTATGGPAVPMPAITGGVVLSVWSDRYELRDVTCDQRTLETFHHLLAVHRHKTDLEGHSVGPLRTRTS